MSFSLSPYEIYQVLILLGLMMLSGNLFINLFVFRRPPLASKDHLKETPLISVCIPARNEALNIGNLLRSLSEQDYPTFEVIVLNDRSEDDTAFVLESYQERLPQLRVINGEPLPAGWVGKCWACHQLSQVARGQYLLFTDADTQFVPQTLSTCVAHAQGTDAALLSLWPAQIAGTWSEKLIIPMVYLLLLVFLPHVLVNSLKNPGLGAANGQFIFFRRKEYDALGGHERVKGHLVEDVGLSRACLSEGFKLVNADGSELVMCRMYHRFADLWEGFTKNLRAAFEKQVGAFVFFGILQMFFFVLPFGFLVRQILCCGWAGLISLSGLLILAQIILIYGIRLVFAVNYKQSIIWAFAHPVGQILALVIALNSWRRTSFSSKGVTWKGRSYHS